MITDNKIFANDSLGRSYGNPIFNGLLSRTETDPKPSKEFIEGYSEAFDFIAGKRSREKLEDSYLFKAMNGKWRK